MHGRVALVTDSTSCIPADLAAHRGRVAPVDRVLGAERALRRMVDTAVRWTNGRSVDIVVEHFGAVARANRVLDRLRPRLGQTRQITLTDVSSAIGVHVGPGAVGISISLRKVQP